MPEDVRWVASNLSAHTHIMAFDVTHTSYTELHHKGPLSINISALL